MNYKKSVDEYLSFNMARPEGLKFLTFFFHRLPLQSWFERNVFLHRQEKQRKLFMYPKGNEFAYSIHSRLLEYPQE
jgi:hypothetical protein